MILKLSVSDSLEVEFVSLKEIEPVVAFESAKVKRVELSNDVIESP